MDSSFYRIQFAAGEQVSSQLQDQAEFLRDICHRLNTSVQMLYSCGLRGTFRDQFDQQQRYLLATLAQFAAETEEAGLDLFTTVKRSREVDAECAALFQDRLRSLQVSQEISCIWVRDLWRFFDPYEIDEGMDYLDDTKAGNSLLDQCKKNGLAFRLPDGELIGAENPSQIVPIRFGDTGSWSTCGYFDPTGDTPEIVIASAYLNRIQSLKSLAGVLAHEMQHALNDQIGAYKDVDIPENFIELSQEEQTTYLEQQVDAWIANEVSAFERGEALKAGREYADDGTLTGDERREIMYDIFGDRSYQLQYEDWINDWYQEQFGEGYEIDLHVDDQGNIQAWYEKTPE